MPYLHLQPSAAADVYKRQGLLREEQIRPVQGQVAVDLVSGDLMIALHAVLPAGVQQHLSTHDVGFQKH